MRKEISATIECISGAAVVVSADSGAGERQHEPSGSALNPTSSRLPSISVSAVRKPRRSARRLERRHAAHAAVDLGRALEVGLNDLVRDDPADRHDQARGGEREPVVVQRIDLDPRIDDVGGAGRDAGEQWIDAGRHETRTQAARHARQGGGETRQGMAASGVEDHRAERDHQHVSSVDRRMREQADGDRHRRQQATCGDTEDGAQPGDDHAGGVGDTDADHRHDHRAERQDFDEDTPQARHELTEGLAVEQVVDHQRLAGARIDDIPLHAGQSPGQQPDQQHQ